MKKFLTRSYLVLISLIILILLSVVFHRQFYRTHSFERYVSQYANQYMEISIDNDTPFKIYAGLNDQKISYFYRLETEEDFVSANIYFYNFLNSYKRITKRADFYGLLEFEPSLCKDSQVMLTTFYITKTTYSNDTLTFKCDLTRDDFNLSQDLNLIDSKTMFYHQIMNVSHQFFSYIFIYSPYPIVLIFFYKLYSLSIFFSSRKKINAYIKSRELQGYEVESKRWSDSFAYQEYEVFKIFHFGMFHLIKFYDDDYYRDRYKIRQSIKEIDRNNYYEDEKIG